MSCQFLSNCSSTISILLVIFTLRLISSAIIRLVGRTSCIGLKLSKISNKLFGPNALFNILMMFDIDILLAAFTNSKFYAGDEVSSNNSIMNNLLANTFVYLYPVAIIYYFYVNRKLVMFDQGKIHELDSNTSDYAFLIEGNKLDHLYSQYVGPFTLLRNYIISCLVVGAYTRPRL